MSKSSIFFIHISLKIKKKDMRTGNFYVQRNNCITRYHFLVYFYVKISSIKIGTGMNNYPLSCKNWTTKLPVCFMMHFSRLKHQRKLLKPSVSPCLSWEMCMLTMHSEQHTELTGMIFVPNDFSTGYHCLDCRKTQIAWT